MSQLKSRNLLPRMISVVSDEPGEALAQEIARQLDAQYISAEVKVFSDGESKIRIPSKLGDACVIVQSTNPPTDPNLIKLLMIATRCMQEGCSKIIAIVPYLAYARQDRAFLDGEIVTIAMVSKLFEAVGIRHVITADIHSERAISCFEIAISNVSAVPLLANYASNMHLQKPIVVSPDIGGQSRARHFADVLKTDSFSLKKSRNRETGVITLYDQLDLDVKDRDCILLDDIISTGESIAKSSDLLRGHGARSVFAFCTHAVLIGDAAVRIRSAGVQEIIATNSIPGMFSKVDLSPILAEATRQQLDWH